MRFAVLRATAVILTLPVAACDRGPDNPDQAEPRSLAEIRESGELVVLPLLAREEYYRDLRYGYARGTEPVRCVRRIREYRPRPGGGAGGLTRPIVITVVVG